MGSGVTVGVNDMIGGNRVEVTWVFYNMMTGCLMVLSAGGALPFLVVEEWKELVIFLCDVM